MWIVNRYSWSKQTAVCTILSERGQSVHFPDPLKLNVWFKSWLLFIRFKLWIWIVLYVIVQSIFMPFSVYSWIHCIVFLSIILSRVANDLAALHTRLQASNLSFLIEFHTLLHLLFLTHSFVTSIISLPPFTDFVTREFGSDTTTMGMNVFCQWLQQETIHLVCEGVFAGEVGSILFDDS